VQKKGAKSNLGGGGWKKKNKSKTLEDAHGLRVQGPSGKKKQVRGFRKIIPKMYLTPETMGSSVQRDVDAGGEKLGSKNRADATLEKKKTSATFRCEGEGENQGKIGELKKGKGSDPKIPGVKKHGKTAWTKRFQPRQGGVENTRIHLLSKTSWFPIEGRQ